MYMLDTNTCIYLINSKSPALAKRISDMPYEDICVSTISQSELAYGVSKSQHKVKNAQALAKFLVSLTSI